MYKIIFAMFIMYGDVNAASFAVNMDCEKYGQRWEESTKTLVCGNLKMMAAACGATFDPSTKTLSCSGSGNINFYCPGGFTQVPIVRGEPITYQCLDNPTLGTPNSLRIVK